MSLKIWIIGAGRFGSRAALKISQMKGKHHLRIVDPLEDNLLRLAGSDHTLEQADGVAYLASHLHPHTDLDWIVPALPLHLAAEWCLLRLRGQGVRRETLPEELIPLVPNPVLGSEGNMYTSHADFICPVNCAEQPEICMVTQRPRPKNMFELLAEIHVPGFQSLVIRSHQIGPGIGGYHPEQLFDLLSQISMARGRFLIATACRCHGVITGLQRV